MNKFYGIRRKSDGKLITGTDFRVNRRSQIVSSIAPPLIISALDLDREIKRRKVSKRYYEIVEISIGFGESIPYSKVLSVTRQAEKELWK